ncbi:hypothetical protein [Paenisporosarcina sp. OV554]|uniref:hypothetical protein n=1 Tax=Paenisporosarcina sp. OV554 TaxID=2135694 RepID=UPI001E285834|nr:hypothetical protein [Paenisporosarcina sp. OV554]
MFSLIAQYIIQQLLIFVELSVNHSISTALLIKINFFIIALVGGIVASHFFIKNSKHIGGISATLFVILSQLYIGNSTLNGSALLVLILVYVVGYVGAILYSNKLAHKRFK